MTSIRLKALLAKGEFILAPGVFEMFSARIADRIGFKALYMTGYGVSGSHLGVADAGLVTYRDMVDRARTIAVGDPGAADRRRRYRLRRADQRARRPCAATRPPGCRRSRSRIRRCRRNAATPRTGA